MQFNHSLSEQAIFKIISKSYELLPNINNRAKLIAWKLNLSVTEVQYYIDVFNNQYCNLNVFKNNR